MTGPVSPSAVRFEHLGSDVLGIGDAAPRLSWTSPPGFEPRAAELRLSGEGAEERIVDVEASGRLVPWPGEPLRSRQRVTVSVRLADRAGRWTPWSPPSTVEAGLLDPQDWSAVFAGPPAAGPAESLPLVRSPELLLDGEVVSARVYATAHGVYELEVNGRPVGDAVLEPGWQSYAHRLRYRTYDVTDLVASSTSVVVGALLGEGWYRGRLGFPLIVRDRVYGDDLAVLVQLELRYADGRWATIASDGTWMWRPGPIIRADLYDGERFDARRVVPGWSSGAEGPGWLPVETHRSVVPLVAPTGPPVRRTQEVGPVARERRGGVVRFDFGQNLVGRVRLQVEGSAGQTVTLRHAEVLEGGELATRPLRTAEATDRYVLAGGGPEVWEPRFTYHGFRYLEVSGPDDVLETVGPTAIVLHTDLRRTGTFSSSDPMLDRLHANVVWGLRGNFVDIPTDCPQRDERLGWTGDIAVFAPTAAFLYDIDGFLRSWLDDLALEQHPDGTVPFFVPQLEMPDHVGHLPGLRHAPTAVWGDAAVTVPWDLYRASGDAAHLERQFASMCRWVDHVLDIAGPSRVWDTGFQFGDWLDPSAPPDTPAAGRTESALVATASLARSASILAAASAVVGREAERVRYERAAEEVADAFRSRFVLDGGKLSSDSQTAYAMALRYGLLAPEHRAAASARLVELVREAGHRIATGFVGTPLILHALSDAGALDDAYRLLLQTEPPSWLYAVGLGATTIWERWDSMLPDGSVNPGEMTSFNHYALGAVAEWMHAVVGGLRIGEPGYRSAVIAPRPGGGLTRASVAHESPAGRIAVDWSLTASGELDLVATVPDGVTANIEVGALRELVGPGMHRRVVATAPDGGWVPEPGGVLVGGERGAGTPR